MMTAIQEPLFEQLRLSRLFDDEQLTGLRRRFADEPADNVLATLVENGTLSRFQAERIDTGQASSLVLGRYALLGLLGQGGYGCVYKARHKLMDRIVALKVIAPERIEDDRARQWFRREVLAATQLIHPNIATAYDADDVDGTLCFAMEYVDGPTLDGLVREQGPLPIGLACAMLEQAAEALAYAHEKGMVHRDIKPANMLVPRQAVAEALTNTPAAAGRAARPVLIKVVDFGLARISNVSSAQTLQLQSEKSFVGTPDYVAPEQARNVHSVDIRSDLYSLGCAFYFALTGQKPFRAGNVMEIIVQHLEKDAVPVEQRRPEVPPILARIIRRLMSKKPDMRFQSPAELLAELGYILGNDRSSSGAIRRPALDLARAAGGIIASDAPASPASAPISQTEPVPHWPEPTRVLPAVSHQTGEMPATMVTPLPDALPAPAETNACAANPPALESTTAAAKTGPLEARFCMAWRRWSDVVERLYEKGQCSLSEAAYQHVYDELIDICRTSAGSDARLRRIEDLVAPWLNVRALAATDRETLASLVTRSRQVGDALGIARRGSIWSWVALAACLVCAASLGWLVTQSRGNFSLDMSFFRSLWISMEAHPIVSLAVVFPAFVAGSIGLFARVIR